MEEQITTEKKKMDLSALLQPKNLMFAAVGSLVLAVLISFIPALLNVLTSGADAQYALQSLALSLSGSIQDLFNGLVLPLALFLLLSNSSKAKLSRIFLIVAVVFVLAQLAGAVILTVHSIAKIDMLSLYYLFSWIPGSSLLSSPVNTIIQIFDVRAGFVTELSWFVSSILRSLSQILYILPNAICAYAFIKLSAAKKRKKPIEAAPEAE